MKSILIATVCALSSIPMLGQSDSHSLLRPASGLVPLGNDSALRPLGTQPDSHASATVSNHQRIAVVSDWSQNHSVFHDSNDATVRARLQQDPRWVQSWYLHHRGEWWPGVPKRRFQLRANVQRDWNVSLGSVTFAPLIDGSGHVDPGAGQTSPAKFTFDVTATPDCAKDYVAIGLPVTPVAGGQANIVAYNNLYSDSGGNGFCTGLGPVTLFAYASGSGMIPAAISMSADGTQLAYIEDIAPNGTFPNGAANFHVLTRDLSGNLLDTNGTSATGSVLPGVAGGNAAVDTVLAITPDGGTTNQASTTAPFVDYVANSAYVTTYSWSGNTNGTAPYQGYIYKIANVFGGGTPSIAWSLPITCTFGPSNVPSSPVYDITSNHVFFTDSGSRLDYAIDAGSSATLVCGNVSTFDSTSVNQPVVDSANQIVYDTINDNGANAIVSEQETTPTGSLGLDVGEGNTTYTAPYNVDFSNDYYNCTLPTPCAGSPLLYTAGTDGSTGTVPTLYAASFVDANLEFTGTLQSAALATGAADSSPVTEFYNSTTSTDYLFVGVTNNCAATGGGSAGCVMSLNITSGFPTGIAGATAIPAAGGPTGIIVDNDSSDPQASSIYYATKTGGTLVKVTQAGLQ